MDGMIRFDVSFSGCKERMGVGTDGWKATADETSDDDGAKERLPGKQEENRRLRKNRGKASKIS